MSVHQLVFRFPTFPVPCVRCGELLEPDWLAYLVEPHPTDTHREYRLACPACARKETGS